VAKGHSGPSMNSLGPGLWAFLAWKGLGVFTNLFLVLVFGLWVIPAATQAAGLEEAPDIWTGSIRLLLEAGFTCLGIGLVLRRHRLVRRFWLSFLSIYCAYFLADLVAQGPTDEGLFYLVTGLLWLAYWLWAPRPRELPLSTYWTGA
jgi:hypothetical protein